MSHPTVTHTQTDHHTAPAAKRTINRRNISVPVVRLGVIGLGILAGTACSAGAADDPASSNGELGKVEEIVLDERVGADGVTERVTMTIGEPASVDFEPVEAAISVVAPWEVASTDSCVGPEVAQPVTESSRGLATQGGVHVAFVVAEFADEAAAQDAQSGTFCFHDVAAGIASELGRTPGVSTHDRRQELGFDGGAQTEFVITAPPFGEPGPTIFSGRVGTSLAFVVDLDNGLDEFDGPNLALELATAG